VYSEVNRVVLYLFIIYENCFCIISRNRNTCKAGTKRNYKANSKQDKLETDVYCESVICYLKL